VVAVDTVAPQVSLTAPADGSTVFGSVAVSATASDNVAVTGVTFQIDGAGAGPAQTTAPYGFTWDSTGVPNGSHTIAPVANGPARQHELLDGERRRLESAGHHAAYDQQRDGVSITATSASVSWTTDEARDEPRRLRRDDELRRIVERRRADHRRTR